MGLGPGLTWSAAMIADDSNIRALGLPNTLVLCADHTARVVGDLLRRHYRDEPDAVIPDHLQSLIEALEARERRSMHASKR